MRLLRPLLIVAAVALAALVPAGSALALSYPVTSTGDGGAKGTLRTSIEEANAHTGPDTIPIEASGTIELGSALQVLFDPVAIVGPGADELEVRRAASNDFAVFGFTTDASPSSLTGLTVSNGRWAFGAGIRNIEASLTLTGVVVRDNEAVDESGAEGGGIYSEGPLTLRETVVTANAARASGNPGGLTKALGGGVLATAPLTIEASTISGNVAEADGDGSATTAQGGGLLAETEASISRSTISGNAVDASGAAAQLRAQGGGIQTYLATITASTVAGNSSSSAGLALGANIHSLVSTTVRGTLLATPLGGADSCSGGLAPGSEEFSSGGYNLDEDGSCELGESSDLVGVVAGLDPVLRNNGGPTPTLSLLEGSIAIDRGSSFGLSVDQRGLPRPSDFPAISDKEGGDGSDIGAFELQAPAARGVEPVRVTETAADRTAPNTRIVSGPPRNTYKREAKFRFASTEAQSRFECRLDKKRWRGCRNPFKRSVKPGKHVFKVRAIDRFGNVDPTPARFGWRVKPLS
ncbi:MAG TPA: choice-of-anchor Q domain-containing protein [Solirubrobacterales bacterium]|nr:choice-of-anchor Q domain-containing protein [Solirubrobacterales bacterium]